METVCIRNNRPSRVVLRARVGNAAMATQCRLVPGEQDVNAELWALMEKQDQTQRFLEEGVLKEMGAKKAKPHPTDATAAELAKASGRRVDTLNNLSDDEALAVIGQTDDREMLKSWRANSENKKLKAAIGKQLKALKNAE